MKNICMVGWYGTETIGDRAILDGILRVFDHVYGKFVLYIGSLYPFFTERTILEDYKVHLKSAPKAELRIVDECNKRRMYSVIKASDLLIMGGGPIMHLNELNFLLDAFRYAKKCDIKTIIMGAGLGPLRGKYYVEIVKKFFKYSDFIIFRDAESLKLSKKLYGGQYEYIDIGDPAVISVTGYMNSVEQHNSVNNEYIACNFREFNVGEYGSLKCNPEDIIDKIIKSLLGWNKKIVFVPMHTFAIGGDDRKYLYTVKKRISSDLIYLPEHPLSLYEVYDIYSNACYCVGMRYHSILIQTILNGNNFVIDYTDPFKGKIRGFLSAFGLLEEYRFRYINLHNAAQSFEIPEMDIGCLFAEKYKINCKFIKNRTEGIFEEYCSLIKSI